MRPKIGVPPLVADSLSALEAREYDRALVLLEEAALDHPDDRELACVVAAVEMKLECLRLLELYSA
jgi:hypothetical protein